MSLSKRSFLYVLGLCLLLLVPMAFGSARAVLLSFEAVERYFFEDDMKRVEKLLSASVAELQRRAGDWETPQTAEEVDRLFRGERNTLLPVRLVAFFDDQSLQIHRIDLEGRALASSEPFSLDLRRSLDRLTEGGGSGQSFGGLLKIGTEAFLVGVFAPGDGRTGVVLGKSADEFRSLMGKLQGNRLELLAIDTTSSTSRKDAPQEGLWGIPGDDYLAFYRAVPDIFGRTDKMFFTLTRTDRPINDVGLRSLLLPGALTLFVGVLVLVFMHVFFEQTILRRLRAIQSVADKVSREWQVELRIPLSGRDEITRLSDSFNVMLETLDKLIQNVPDPLFLSDPEGRILLVNAAACTFLGYGKDELTELSLNAVFLEEESRDGPVKYAPTEADDIFEGPLLRKDGHRIAVEIHQESLTLGGRFLTLSVARDLTERKQMEARLVQMAFYDTQTGLPNRHYFLDELEKEIRNITAIPNYAISVVLLNFDRFRLIIEQLGPRNADRLLVEVVRKIEGMIAGFASTFRMNGDEFGVIVRGTNSKDYVESMVARLRRLVSSPVVMEGQTIFPSVSFGIVLDVQGADTSALVLSRAAQALVKGRKRGMGTVTFHAPGDEETADDYNLLTAQADIQRGLAASEFIPYFQPIYELSPQRLAGVEVLARWNHPTQGFLAPSSFIPLAEETGLIFELDKHMIQEAMQVACRWGEHDPKSSVFVSANASGVSFKNPDFFPFLEKLIQESACPPKTFVLEVTEGILLEELEKVKDKLARIRELGIKVALDDFGTGYSSLQYVSQLPIDYLKIDKSFIDQLFLSEKNSRMVRSIINMAWELGLGVVAEGIENEDQLHWLSENKNLRGQGYFFSRPVPLPEAEGYLADARAFEGLKWDSETRDQEEKPEE